MLDSLVYICMCAWYIVLLMLSLVVIVVVACIGMAGVYAVFVNCVVPTTNTWKINNARTKKELLELSGIDAKEADKQNMKINLEKSKRLTAEEADKLNMKILEKW